MVTYLGSLVQSCCGEGGTLQTNITGVCGECLQCMDHTGFAPAHGACASRSTLLRLQVSLQGNCLKWAPGCVHFPGLRRSGSGSRVLHEGTDSVGPTFCALPRSKQLRQPGAWQGHTPQVGGTSYHLSGPSCLVSSVHSRSTVSGVPCVSSGVLISSCSLPGGCQPSRIPGRLG